MIECPKCKYEHETEGIHEEDSGEWSCDNCEFKFTVEIEYDPIYTSTCIEHEWGEWETKHNTSYGPITIRNCKYCYECEVQRADVYLFQWQKMPKGYRWF